MITPATNAYHGDASAVFVNGEIVAAVEEERVTRQKRQGRFLVESMRWCLGDADALVEPSAVSIRDGIRRLASDSDLRRHFADAGLSRALTLAPGVIAQEQESIYLDAIAAAAR